MKRSFVIVAGILSVLALPFAAAAHNAGHLFLPDGSCQQVGSFKEAPFVGPDKIQLDLVPQTPLPRDEYGVSFVGFGRGTPILPGGCPAVIPAGGVAQDPDGIPDFAAISYQ
jgi:hypothetical protein